ncbi:MAG: DUF4410 domain-containing protein [Deltaproteobacteria bacterium]|nr:DUF4410 domain-containing protein [Deltaproteobacteria bacterium]
MKKRVSLFLVLVAMVLAGCGTKSSYMPTPSMEALNPSAGFRIDQVNDSSGYVFPGGAQGAFDLRDAMSSALRAELTRQGLAADNGLYAVNVNILAYVPGNAFARYLLPGAGATKLYVEALILDRNYIEVAKIPVYRHIGAGGALTVGAHKYVFEDVAKEIASILKDPARMGAGKSRMTYGF